MEEKKTTKSFVGGAALLGAAGLISKLLGACFRIPLANIIGDNGMGYYQTAYPIYIGLLSISSTGLPTAISRMVAERRAQGNYQESQRVYKLSMRVMIAIGLVTGVSLAVFAPQICRYIEEPDAVYCMYSLAPALIFCPIISAIRGYFQGQQNMKPTAISQVIEQIFRVGIGIILAILLLKKGLPQAAAGATFGASAGGLFALLFMILAISRQKAKRKEELELPYDGPVAGSGAIIKEMFGIAIPITLGSLIMPIINTIDTVIVKSRLVSIGYDSVTARSMFGQLSGMASPIINLPDAVTAAVCMSLVPVIADARKRSEEASVKSNTQLAVRYAAIAGVPCAIGIFVLAKPIMLMLYTRQQTAALGAAGCLRAYAAGVFFLAIHQAMSGVLQGIGKQNLPVINLLVGAVVKIFATYTLCSIPAINVKGAAYGTVIAYAIAAFLSYLSVKKHTGVEFNLNLCFVRPIISGAVMGVIVWLVFHAAEGHFGNSVSTLLAVAGGVLVYVIMIFATKTITVDDLRGVKKLEKLTNLLDKVRPSGKM